MASMAQAAQVGAGLAQQGTAAVKTAGGSGTLAAAAAIGGAAGLILLGPLTAVAAAGAAAYATTRTDEVGDVARGTAKAAIDGVDAARQFDAEHNISGRAVSAAKAAAAKAKEVCPRCAFRASVRVSLPARALFLQAGREAQHHRARQGGGRERHQQREGGAFVTLRRHSSAALTPLLNSWRRSTT